MGLMPSYKHCKCQGKQLFYVEMYHKKHRLDLSKYYERLIRICVQSGETCFAKVRHKENSVPYWSEAVESLKDKALRWHDI